jgi:hypothetical protein
MSLVESAAARLGKDPPGFVGSIGTVFSESAQRAAFEITSARGVTLVAKAHLSRESYDRELIGWLTARQCGLSAPLFWYPYFKAEPPYVLTYARIEGEPLSSADPDDDWRGAGLKLRVLHMVKEPLDLPRFHRGGGTWLESCRQRLVAEIRWGNSAGFLSDGAAESLVQSGLSSLDLDEEPRQTFIHGDLQPEHILLRCPGGRGTVFLDFGDAGLGDPAWDLVALSLYDPDRLAILLDGYRAMPEFVEHVEQVRLGYRLLRHLSAARWLTEHELDPQLDVLMALRLI